MKRIGVLVLVCGLAGCVTPTTKRFYDGEPRPAESVARIHDAPTVGTTAVDGQGFFWLGNHVVEVLPGERRLSVSLMGAYYSPDDYELRFMATPGADYQLDAYLDPGNSGWRPLLIDMKTQQEVPYEKIKKP